MFGPGSSACSRRPFQFINGNVKLGEYQAGGCDDCGHQRRLVHGLCAECQERYTPDFSRDYVREAIANAGKPGC
jgi:hypothetical protein